MNQHTFVICAYKESCYLEECIKSIKTQTVKSDVVMVTSTPSSFLTEMSEKYDIPLMINQGQGGIVQDWNYGYRQATTPYITIAHQDDIYFERYTEKMLGDLKKSKHPLIAFSDYVEVRNGRIVKSNRLLQIKRVMLFPLRIESLWNSKFVRRRILSLGCPICCPSVTFVRKNLPVEIFEVGFRSDEDWQAWEKLSKIKGSFVYNKEALMGHRIHEESETSNILRDNERVKEDYRMFCKFWPKSIAKMLVHFYSKGEESNEL